MKASFFALGVLPFLAASAWADGETAPQLYDCNLIVVDSRLPDGVQNQTFQALAQANGSHGGDPYLFTIGTNHFSVTADARWRGIEWTRDGVAIANMVEVNQTDLLQSHVTMVYNPANLDESAALECHPTEVVAAP